jgi:uncharacterized protein YprB with RNaseH-like and TPR domain
MLDLVNIENILFLDIETVPLRKSYAETTGWERELWEKKSLQYRTDGQSAEDVYSKAGIHAEFGRIIVISCGFFTILKGRNRVFRVKSFFGNDEKILLEDFSSTLNRLNNFILCAHNGKEFDFPYIARRILINKLRLPRQLNIHGKKPWEIPHLDTMDLWKFGDYKNYTSLSTLANVFGLPTSKDDIDGSQVAEVYYNEGNLKRIAEYCEKDMITVARIFQCLRSEIPLEFEELEFIR